MSNDCHLDPDKEDEVTALIENYLKTNKDSVLRDIELNLTLTLSQKYPGESWLCHV